MIPPRPRPRPPVLTWPTPGRPREASRGDGVSKRRDSLCNREWMGLTSHPHHRVVFPIGALHQIGYVADAIPVNDCGNSEFFGPVALVIQTRAFWQHPGD